MKRTTRSLPKNKRRSRAAGFALTGAIFLSMLVGVCGQAQAAPPADTLVPVYSWWSSTLGDNFATTDPAWAGTRPGEVRGAYRFNRVIGYVFDPARPQPPGTKKLFRWWSPTRGDQFLTTAASWDPALSPMREPDYEFRRMEGFVLDTARAGTRPMTNWYDPSREDNFATSEPEWGPGVAATSGSYTRSATEGYVVSPSGSEDFGFGTMTSRDLNSEARAVPAEGTRRLLVVLMTYTDSPYTSLRRDRDYYEQLFFGPGSRNVADYFAENSDGKFRWSEAGVVSVTYPGTRQDANNAGNEAVGAEAIRGAARAGFDICAQDRNHDGKVTVDELGVVWMGAADPGEYFGQTVPYTAPSAVPVTVPGRCSVNVYASTSGLAEDETLSTIAHELAHQLGAADIYGSSQLSLGMSLMSCPVGCAGPIHLDPWHKIRLGWAKPRIYATTNPAASVKLLAAEGCPSCADVEPVILYDPSRGRNEYFILEFRTRAEGVYDANMADTVPGVAVWYVRTNPDGSLLSVAGIGGAGTFDNTNWMVGSPPDQWAPGYRGQSTLWNSGHGEFTLRSAASTTGGGWFDGTATNMRIQVGAVSSPPTGIDVQWRNSSLSPLSARIDELRGDVATRGSIVIVKGDFGVGQGSKLVSVVRGLERRDLQVVRWGATQLTVRVPYDTPLGPSQVVVYKDGSLATPSNRLPITIASG